MTAITGYVTLDGVDSSLHPVKLRNRHLVLSYMRGNTAVSVNQISRATALSKMTVHKILSHYLAEGLIVHAGKGNSTEEGGKKPNLFAFNAHSRYLFAVRLENRHVITLVANLKGEVLVQPRPVSIEGAGFGEALAAIASSFRDVVQNNSLSQERFVAVVVSCNGVVDADGRCAVIHDHPDWGVNLPFRDRLRITIPSTIPIHLDCWWRYMAFTESLQRVGKQGTFFLFGNSGDHLAGGLVMAGQVYRGRSGLAGELGHLRTADQQSQEGVTFASIASPGAVLARAKAKKHAFPHSTVFRNGLRGGIMDIGEAANQGDTLGRQLMENLADNVAYVFGNIVLVCDPGMFVLYGDYAKLGEYFRSRLETKLGAARLNGIDTVTAVEYSSAEEYAGVIGAATYITDSLFT